jgi:hypothetical protein
MRASRAPRASSSCCSHTAARWARDWWANGKPRALDLRGTTANTLHRGGRGPSQPRPLSCLFPLLERTCRTAFTSHHDEISFPSDPARSLTAGHMAADGHLWTTHTRPLGTETFLRTAHVDAQIPTIKFEWQQSRQGGQGFIEGRRIPCGVPIFAHPQASRWGAGGQKCESSASSGPCTQSADADHPAQGCLGQLHLRTGRRWLKKPAARCDVPVHIESPDTLQARLHVPPPYLRDAQYRH